MILHNTIEYTGLCDMQLTVRRIRAHALLMSIVFISLY